MASIGIIANPASGKDIRRLVSYATTIDNNEKVNICKRIVLAAQGLGVESAYFMPETFMIGYAVKDSLESDGVLSLSLGVLDFEIEAAMEDTVRSARMLEELGVGCIVVLGGDGTSRAAAKGITKTPMLSISTGTNNVYPAMMEGTVAGMAAAAVALMDEPYSCCIHDKRITVRVNGEAEITAAEGNGPVNALDVALRKALERFYPSLKEFRLTDYKVRILDSRETSSAITRVLIESSDEKDVWTTVGVSRDIIEASLIAMTDALEYKLIKDEERKTQREDT